MPTNNFYLFPLYAPLRPPSSTVTVFLFVLCALELLGDSMSYTVGNWVHTLCNDKNEFHVRKWVQR